MPGNNGHTDELDRLRKRVAELEEYERQCEMIRAEMEETQHFLQTLIDTIPIPIYYKDMNGIYRGCNRTLEKYLGLGREDIIGHNVFDLWKKELADLYYMSDYKLMHEGGIQVYQGHVINSVGELRDVVFHKAVFYKRDGAKAGIVGALIDVTDRVRADRAMKQSQNTLDLALEAVDLGIWDLNLESFFITLNKKSVEIFGFSFNVISHSLKEHEKYILQEDYELYKKAFVEHLEGLTERFTAQFRIRDVHNNIKMIQARGKVVEFDSNNLPLRMMGTYRVINNE